MGTSDFYFSAGVCVPGQNCHIPLSSSHLPTIKSKQESRKFTKITQGNGFTFLPLKLHRDQSLREAENSKSRKQEMEGLEVGNFNGRKEKTQ